MHDDRNPFCNCRHCYPSVAPIFTIILLLAAAAMIIWVTIRDFI